MQPNTMTETINAGKEPIELSASIATEAFIKIASRLHCHTLEEIMAIPIPKLLEHPSFSYHHYFELIQLAGHYNLYHKMKTK